MKKSILAFAGDLFWHKKKTIKQLQGGILIMEIQKTLTVSLKSFSYKRGIPYDASGNGGGYVFDCRALNNPGQYDEYKNLTGKDKDVEDFLLKKSRVLTFLDFAKTLVTLSIQEYTRLGYSHLEVDFGCTGGQHRSVYCVEAMAKFLNENFPQVNIEVKHLELEK